MTLLEKFKKDHPNVSLAIYEAPKVCPYTLGYEQGEDSTPNCVHNNGKGCEYCWNRKYKGEETQGLDEVKTKLTITLELHELNNFTLAGKIFEICKNDNIHYLDPLTIAKMLDAEVCNERRKKDDVQRKIGYGAS